MVYPSEILKLFLREIFIQNIEIIQIACQQRAKFEGWLKFELASNLAMHREISNVCIEDTYYYGGISDISFRFQNKKFHIEIKTANTNWRAEGLETLSRPITRNISGIIRDIHKLRLNSPPANGLAVFVIFPIPIRIIEQSNGQLEFFLKRIENESGFETGKLGKILDFLKVTKYYGIGIFVLEII